MAAASAASQPAGALGDAASRGGQPVRARRLMGLLGANLSDSFPRKLERACAKIGMDAWCQTLDLDQLGLQGRSREVVEGAKMAGYSGLAVTMPSKQDAMQACESVCEDARAIGAVNCIAFDAQRRAAGYNFDWLGARLALEEKLGEAFGRPHVIVLGAGGVGRAVIFALGRMGAARVTVADTDESRAGTVIRDLEPVIAPTAISFAATGSLPPDAEGLVNCTPVGMAGGPPGLPVPETDLDAPSLQWVFEVGCHPAETPLLQAAIARGKVAVRGDRMNWFVIREIFAVLSGVPRADVPDDFLD